jgi:hypothetical protein
MKYPKRLFPHIYEFQRLGKDETPEGQKYLHDHPDIDKEFSDAIDLTYFRKEKGNKFFHKITEDEHT